MMAGDRKGDTGTHLPERVRWGLISFLSPFLLVSGFWSPGQAQGLPETSNLQDRALEFAQAWVNSDVGALEAMMEAGGIRLQLQGGQNVLVTPPQARAAIANFMNRYEGGEAELFRAALLAEDPGTGFAEFQWTCRLSGLQAPVIFSLFVALRWNDPGWTVTEIRLLP